MLPFIISDWRACERNYITCRVLAFGFNLLDAIDALHKCRFISSASLLHKKSLVLSTSLCLKIIMTITMHSVTLMYKHRQSHTHIRALRYQLHSVADIHADPVSFTQYHVIIVALPDTYIHTAKLPYLHPGWLDSS